MESHSVICHQAAVTLIPLLPAKVSTRLATLVGFGCKAELTSLSRSYISIYFICKIRSAISKITGNCCGWELISLPKVASPTSQPLSHLYYCGNYDTSGFSCPSLVSKQIRTVTYKMQNKTVTVRCGLTTKQYCFKPKLNLNVKVQF